MIVFAVVDDKRANIESCENMLQRFIQERGDGSFIESEGSELTSYQEASDWLNPISFSRDISSVAHVLLTDLHLPDEEGGSQRPYGLTLAIEARKLGWTVVICTDAVHGGLDHFSFTVARAVDADIVEVSSVNGVKDWSRALARVIEKLEKKT